ncbi:MAG: formylglycine-generating enzyme family protein, partial [Treponema sp.]|nr:formylglycine-generating enzyme family protein [Treponema sp.]
MDVAPAQGSSTPAAGLIVNPALRQGFGFPLQYFPSVEYHFVEWQAGNWDENNKWVPIKDPSIVIFESPNSTITNVIINTTEPITLRPYADERPYVQHTNLVWGNVEYLDQVIRVKFSRRMDPKSLNWNTIKITSYTRDTDAWVKDYNESDFNFSDNPESDHATLYENDTLLELKPIGDVLANTRIEITFKRMKNGTEPGVIAEGNIQLSKDIVISYRSGHTRGPKLRFAVDEDENVIPVKFATRNGNTWNVWDDSDYDDSKLAHRVSDNKQVYIVFLPDKETTVTGIRVTETQIRRPPQYPSLDKTVIERNINSEFLTVSRAHIEKDFAGTEEFPSDSEPLAVLYTLKTFDDSWLYNSYGGVRLKVELYNGISYSDGADNTPEGPAIVQTKFDTAQKPVPDIELKPVKGVRLAFGYYSSTFYVQYYFSYGNTLNLYSHSQAHALPYCSSDFAAQARGGADINDYSLGEIQVTERFWRIVHSWALFNGYSNISSGSSRGDNFPVTNVSWQDVIVWCNAYSQLSGLTPVYQISDSVIKDAHLVSNSITMASTNGFRLPYEIEWDYAARGGINTERALGTPWFFNYSG